MQTGGQGGYNDPSVYHDANRYDWISKFSLNINRQSTELNAFAVHTQATVLCLHMSKALNSLLPLLSLAVTMIM